MQRMLVICLLGAALAGFSTPARADGDVVRFGANIHVGPDAEAQDVVCFFCSLNIEGKVTGDAVAVFGSIRITGDVQHDAVDLFGTVTAEKNSSVDNDLVSVLGAVRLGENVTIGQDLWALFGSLEAADSATIGNDRIVKPAWMVLGPLGILFLIVFVIVREYKAYMKRLKKRGYKFPPKEA